MTSETPAWRVSYEVSNQPWAHPTAPKLQGWIGGMYKFFFSHTKNVDTSVQNAFSRHPFSRLWLLISPLTAAVCVQCQTDCRLTDCFKCINIDCGHWHRFEAWQIAMLVLKQCISLFSFLFSQSGRNTPCCIFIKEKVLNQQCGLA